MKELMKIFDDMEEIRKALSRFYDGTFYKEMQKTAEEIRKTLSSFYGETSYTDMYVKKGEKPNETILQLDVPGVERDGIKVFTQGRKLVVEATRNDREKENTKRFVYFSEGGDIKVRKASLKNGVLTLTIEEGPSVDEVQIEIE